MAAKSVIFLSYSHRDAEIATELASRLEDAKIPCFLAERDVYAAQQWEPRIRDEIRKAICVLLLLTPRLIGSKWVAIETGAAWVLKKDIVPATMFVDLADLHEPIRSYQTRSVETTAQVTKLIQELQERLSTKTGKLPTQGTVTEATTKSPSESFTDPLTWPRLQKIGGWQIDENSRVFSGGGVNNYLLSHFSYGSRSFRVATQLRFKPLAQANGLRAMNGGLVFGWVAAGNVLRYYHLMFNGSHVLRVTLESC